MKKITNFLMIIFLLVMYSCSTVQEVPSNDIRATLITNKGNIDFYLYPETAPKTVNRFIELINEGAYNNLTFKKNGDVLYIDLYNKTILKDEKKQEKLENKLGEGVMIASYLNKEEIIISLVPLWAESGKDVVFGEYITEGDLNRLKKISTGDTLKRIDIRHNITGILGVGGVPRQEGETRKDVEETYLMQTRSKQEKVNKLWTENDARDRFF